MILHAWRIVKAKHAPAAFSGHGAKIAGGRWNSPGTPMVYTAGSHSLAILEMLVHLQFQNLLERYVLFELMFSADLAKRLDRQNLPKTWRKFPAPLAVKRIGDAWVRSGESAILRVPSVIVPSESNFLLNPAHRDFSKIELGAKQPLKLDARLLRN